LTEGAPASAFAAPSPRPSRATHDGREREPQERLPFVSVVVPVRNGEKTIAECLSIDQRRVRDH
jgi:hypothetical protein